MLLIDSPEKVSGNDLGYSVFQLSVESQQSMMNLYFSQKKMLKSTGLLLVCRYIWQFCMISNKNTPLGLLKKKHPQSDLSRISLCFDAGYLKDPLFPSHIHPLSTWALGVDPRSPKSWQAAIFQPFLLIHLLFKSTTFDYDRE